MHRLDLTLPTLAENLALDESLLLDAVAGAPPVLRLWKWPSFAVVMGAGGKRCEEANVPRCEADTVPIVRRSSGGGTVLLGPGCLLYSLVLPIDAHPDFGDLHRSYRHIAARLAAALAAVKPGISHDGISDLVWNDRKVSGNAQQRKRTHFLHHGTLLDDFDLAAIDRYVKHPPKMPNYRRDRPHEEFVANLHVGAERLKEIIAAAFGADVSSGEWPREHVARLVDEKYGQEEWHQRR